MESRGFQPRRLATAVCLLWSWLVVVLLSGPGKMTTTLPRAGELVWAERLLHCGFEVD